MAETFERILRSIDKEIIMQNKYKTHPVGNKANEKQCRIVEFTKDIFNEDVFQYHKEF